MDLPHSGYVSPESRSMVARACPRYQEARNANAAPYFAFRGTPSWTFQVPHLKQFIGHAKGLESCKAAKMLWTQLSPFFLIERLDFILSFLPSGAQEREDLVPLIAPALQELVGERVTEAIQPFGAARQLFGQLIVVPTVGKSGVQICEFIGAIRLSLLSFTHVVSRLRRPLNLTHDPSSAEPSLGAPAASSRQPSNYPPVTHSQAPIPPDSDRTLRTAQSAHALNPNTQPPTPRATSSSTVSASATIASMCSAQTPHGAASSQPFWVEANSSSSFSSPKTSSSLSHRSRTAWYLIPTPHNQPWHKSTRDNRYCLALMNALPSFPYLN
ncbi:hypothetical protein BC826DRAFT_1101394 [Russula brevipes]|nr:hypothetical protein BC826DRAFT_1101394 [Russula brevipes]